LFGEIKAPYPNEVELTDREEQVVALLRHDPMMSSDAIAERLGTTRAAVNVHLSNLGKKGVILGRGYILNDQPTVVVIGGANADIKARSAAPVTQGTSNPGRSSMTPGGVGRNIAENIARLGTRTFLVTAVGRDAAGDDLLDKTSAAGVRLEYVYRTNLPTGTYTAVLNANGELVVAVADMSAADELGPEQVNRARNIITAASLIVVDGNVPAETLAHCLDLAHAGGVRIIFEPVSVPKATMMAPYVTANRPLYAITPNRDELTALTGLPARTDRQIRLAADKLHKRGVEYVWVRLGARGSLLSSASNDATAIPAVPTTVADVTGAGDSTLAAFCHALLGGKDPVEAARYGHAAASLTIASRHTVRPDLSEQLIEAVLNPSTVKERA
jgi:pseudouridine kinase